jgi:DNA polymerase-1
MIIDLETFRAEDWARRKDTMRLGGCTLPDRSARLTTDGDEIARAVAGADVVGGSNIFAYDLPILALHHGLDLTKLIGKCRDSELLLRLVDPPPSGHKGQVSRDLRPAGYYGLNESCKRYGLPHKTNDAKAMAKKHAAVAERLRAGKPIRPEDRIGDLDQIARLTPAATLPNGKLDGYGLIPADDPDFTDYLRGDLIASGALIDHLSPLDHYAEREMNGGLITAQMMVNGLRVDIDELNLALDEQADRRRRHLLELHDLTGMPLNGKAPIRSNDGNRAIEKALIDCGLSARSLPRTENTGMLSTGKDDLGVFRDKIQKFAKGRDVSKILRIIELVISVSGERSIYQTIDDTRIDDRVHPTIKATQASARWSMTGPGITVMGKREGRFVERRVILAEEGEVLVCFDLDQIDARMVAANCRDEMYMEIFRQGLDLHGEVAMTVFGTLEKRDIVKPLNHGLNYRMGPKKAALHTGLPLTEVYQYMRGIEDKYPGIGSWQDRMYRLAMSGQLLDNGFGRKLRADPRFAYTQAPALVGQGGTRDVILEGLLRMPTFLWPMMRAIVHDEIVFSFPENDVEELSRIVLAAMQFDLYDVTNGALAHMPITAGISPAGKNWADCYRKG